MDQKYKDIANSCIMKQIKALSHLPLLIDSEKYQKVIKHLSKYKDYSKRIIITGVGKNSNIATKISETMASLGIPSFYLNISHCSHGDFGYIGPKDTIIHISRSGTTKEMIEASGYIFHKLPKSITQILIHCNKECPDYGWFNHILYCGPVEEGDENNLAPTSSTTMLLCAMDTIACILSSMNGFTRTDFLKFHPGGSLGKMLSDEQKDES